MSLGFPVAPPTNGDDLDASVVTACLNYILQILQAYDLSNAAAGTMPDAAFSTTNSPLQRYIDMFNSFIVSGGLSSGFTVLAYSVPAITVAYFQSNGKAVRSINGVSKTAAINSDTYVYVNSSGVIDVVPVANNAAQPSLPSADSQWLQKVVSNGTTITAIVDLRNLSPISAPWIAPTFTNSWVNYDVTTYNPAGYTKGADGVVRLRGLVKLGTAGASVFTLPVGYRPSLEQIYTVMSGAGAQRLDVYANGTILPSVGASNAYVSLEGIAFKAYQ